jgi:hypothetical protein
MAVRLIASAPSIRVFTQYPHWPKLMLTEDLPRLRGVMSP